MKTLYLVLLAIAVSGCATTNPFQQYYFDHTEGVDITTLPRVIPPPEEPKLIKMSGSIPKDDIPKMIEEGYLFIGHSFFNASEFNEKDVLSFAKQVHAETILFYSQYIDTVTDTVPVVRPESTEINTDSSGRASLSGRNDYSGTILGNNNSKYYSGTGSISGSGRYASNTKTTVRKYKTDYVPVTVNRFDFFASYWARMKPPVLGVVARDLRDSERKELETNKGVVASIIIKGSPAFQADIMKDDFLLQMNKEEIIDSQDFQKKIEQFHGQKITLTLMRNKRSLTKEVQLNKIEDFLSK